MEDVFEFTKSINPWSVKDLQEFQSYHCSNCDFKNVKHSEFIKHIEEFHDSLKSFEFLFYNCPECESKSSSKMGFIKHAVNHHDNSACLMESLNVQTEKENSPKKFKCDKCDSSFSDQAMLGIHEKYMHSGLTKDSKTVSPDHLPKGPDLQKCVECNKAFPTGQDVIKHLGESHADTFDFKCDQCEFKAKSTDALIEHCKTPHENKVQPKLIAVRRKPIQQVKKVTIVTVAAKPNIATGNGSISENTQDHNRKRKQLFQPRIDEVYIKTVEVTKTEPNKTSAHICKVCGPDRGYKNRTDLELHLRTHSQKELQDSYTPKSKTNLVRQCKICQQVFENALDLIDHEHCPMCNEAFKGSAAMKDHIATHPVSDYKYSCRPCNKGFLTKSNLDYHTDKIHHLNSSIKEVHSEIASQKSRPDAQPVKIHHPDSIRRDTALTIKVPVKAKAQTLLLPIHKRKESTSETIKVKCFTCNKIIEKPKANFYNLLKQPVTGVLLTKCTDCIFSVGKGKAKSAPVLTSKDQNQGIVREKKNLVDEQRKEKVTNKEFIEAKEVENTTHKCDTCRLSFKSEKDSTIHFLGVHRRIFRHYPCCTEYPEKDAFICHYIQSHSSASQDQKDEILAHFNRVPCLKCDGLLVPKELLEMHINEYHKQTEDSSTSDATDASSHSKEKETVEGKDTVEEKDQHKDGINIQRKNKVANRETAEAKEIADTTIPIESTTVEKQLHRCDSCRSSFTFEKDLTIHVLGLHRRLLRQFPCCTEIPEKDSFICHYIQSHSSISQDQKNEILAQFNQVSCNECPGLLKMPLERLEMHMEEYHKQTEDSSSNEVSNNSNEEQNVEETKIKTDDIEDNSTLILTIDKVKTRNAQLVTDLQNFVNVDSQWQAFEQCQLCNYKYFNRLDLCRHFIDRHLQHGRDGKLIEDREYYWTKVDLKLKISNFSPTSDDFTKEEKDPNVTSLPYLDFDQVFKVPKCELCAHDFGNVKDLKKTKLDHMTQHFSMKDYCPCIIDGIEKKWGFSEHKSAFELDLFLAFHQELGEKWSKKYYSKSESDQLSLYQRLFKAHRKSVKAKADFPYDCKQCDHCFRNNESLDSHTSAIHKEIQSLTIVNGDNINRLVKEEALSDVEDTFGDTKTSETSESKLVPKMKEVRVSLRRLNLKHIFSKHKDIRSLTVVNGDNIDSFVKEEIIDKVKDTSEVPTFMKEVRVSLRRLNLKHPLMEKFSNKRKRTPENETANKRSKVELTCNKCKATFGSEKILNIHMKLIKH